MRPEKLRVLCNVADGLEKPWGWKKASKYNKLPKNAISTLTESDYFCKWKSPPVPHKSVVEPSKNSASGRAGGHAGPSVNTTVTPLLSCHPRGQQQEPSVKRDTLPGELNVLLGCAWGSFWTRSLSEARLFSPHFCSVLVSGLSPTLLHQTACSYLNFKKREKLV